jgi:aldehyde:ferredoxin oxidoreductase
MNGWMGKIIKIDLGSMKQETVSISTEMRRQYLGGRGLGVKLYTELCHAQTDPFAADNALIFMTGPLTGTVMTSGRYQVVSRSPLTGTICDSSSGGSFGAVLKNAGLDGLVIQGQAAKPVYLYVHDGEIEVRDASVLWGLNTQQTQKAVQAETTAKTAVACIGPAGENRVIFASIMNDKDRAAGRGGMGAVMGAKNLKAIAASGTLAVAIADPEGYKTLNARIDRIVDKNPVTGKSLQVLGTSVLVNIINAHGMFPTENFRRGVFNDAEGTSGEKIAETPERLLQVPDRLRPHHPDQKQAWRRAGIRNGVGLRRPPGDQRPDRHHRGQLRLQRAGPRHHHHGQHHRLRHGAL